MTKGNFFLKKELFANISNSLGMLSNGRKMQTLHSAINCDTTTVNQWPRS